MKPKPVKLTNFVSRWSCAFARRPPQSRRGHGGRLRGQARRRPRVATTPGHLRRDRSRPSLRRRVRPRRGHVRGDGQLPTGHLLVSVVVPRHQRPRRLQAELSGRQRLRQPAVRLSAAGGRRRPTAPSGHHASLRRQRGRDVLATVVRRRRWRRGVTYMATVQDELPHGWAAAPVAAAQWCACRPPGLPNAKGSVDTTHFSTPEKKRYGVF